LSAWPQFRPEEEPDKTPLAARNLEAQQMESVGRLVSGVAHDFNNLLTGIVLCSDLLLVGLEKESRLRRYAQEIRTAAGRGADMIQQLLAVARHRSFDTQVLSLNGAIAEMRDLLTRLIGENITLASDLAEDLALVEMAPAQLQQIVLNLVLNARDAMPEGGRITLSTRNHRDGLDRAEEGSRFRYVQFEVHDSGSGMDAETRSRVFEPFFTTKKPGQGNGLGLATVYSIVKNHGGTIEIDSEPAKGTHVKIRLPAVPSGQPSRAGDGTPQAAATYGPPRGPDQVQKEKENSHDYCGRVRAESPSS